MKDWKRILAIGLSAVMIMGSLPTSIYAKEDSHVDQPAVTSLSGEEKGQQDPEDRDLLEEAELMEEGVVPTPVTPAGSGTKDSPYKITSLGNLIFFCRYFYGTETTYISFGNNIYINDPIDWKAVISEAGRSESYVRALFADDVHTFVIDGRGFSIYGLDIPLMNETTTTNVISNLVLRESAISGDYRSALVIENKGKIENCKVTGSSLSLSGSYFGPICYRNMDTGIITNCTNEASVTGTGTSTFVGGICCENSGTLQDCVNKGKLTAPYAGGIVWAEDAYLSRPHALMNCVNYGEVTASGAAGIAYKADPYAQISDSSNFGSIIGKASGSSTAVTLGGICGVVSGSTTQGASITGCASYGDITSESTNSITKLGGIAAEASAAHIEECYVEGMDTDRASISTVGGTVGGLVGNAKLSTQITNCFARADLSGGAVSGGLIGTIEGSASADHSYSASVQNKVGSSSYTPGAFIGKATGSSGERKLERCYYDKTLNTNASVGEGSDIVQMTNCDGKTTTQFASGAVRDLLNTLSDSMQEVWHQEVSGTEKDPYPVLVAEEPSKPIPLFETEGIHFLYYTKDDNSIVLDRRETVYLTADTQNLLTEAVKNYENCYVWVKVVADTENNRSVVEKIMPVKTQYGLLSEIRADHSVVIGDTVYTSEVDFNAADVNRNVLIFLQNEKIVKYSVLKKTKLQTIGNITETTIGIDGVAMTIARGANTNLKEKASEYKAAIETGSKDVFYYLSDSFMLLYDLLQEKPEVPSEPNLPSYTLVYHIGEDPDVVETIVRVIDDHCRLDDIQNLFAGIEGKAFSHWTTLPKGKGRKYNNEASIKAIVRQDITIDLYANWKAIKYTIEYQPNGGKGKKKVFNVSGKGLTKLKGKLYNRVGYKQTGWIDSDGNEYALGAKIPPLTGIDGAKIVLKAIWTENTYHVKYDANQGVLPKGKKFDHSVTVKYSQDYTIAENPYERDGYDFVCWNTSAKGNGYGYPAGAVISKKKTTGDFKLYAKWRVRNNGDLTYQFDSVGGSLVKDLVLKKTDRSMKSLPIPTKKGYVFAGWECSNGKTYAKDAKVGWIEAWQGQTFLMTAKWDSLSYSITFQAGNETSEVKTESFRYDQSITVDERGFKYPEHDLVGWAISENAEEPDFKAGDVISGDSFAQKTKWKDGENIKIYMIWQDTSPWRLRESNMNKLYNRLEALNVTSNESQCRDGAFSTNGLCHEHYVTKTKTANGSWTSTGDGCSKCSLKNIIASDWFANSGILDHYTKEQAKTLDANIFDGKANCQSCVGFARFAEWYAVSGGDPTVHAGLETVTDLTNKKFGDAKDDIEKYCLPGDYIWFSKGHAVVFLSAQEDGIMVIDSNNAVYSRNYSVKNSTREEYTKYHSNVVRKQKISYTGSYKDSKMTVNRGVVAEKK